MKRLHLVTLVLLLLLVAVLLTISVEPAYAATFVVDSTTDAANINIGDGVCVDTLGNCSLRAAIQEANALGGSHTITLTGGQTYTIDITGAGEDAAVTGDLDVTATIAINVTGAGAAIIAGDINFNDRLFDVQGGGQLDLNSGITVQNSNSLSTILDGGGINVRSGAELNTTGVTIQANRAVAGNARGGGIFNAGTAYLSNTVIASNTASGTTSEGCGIYNDTLGTLTLTAASVIRAHLGCTNGAGLYNAGTATLNAGSSVGAASPGGNSASNNGGGIYNTGTLTLDNASVIGNSATNHGGGIWSNNTVTINNNAAIGVSGTPNTAASGGGIWVEGGTAAINSSSVSYNTASGTGGGGIYLVGDFLNLTSARVTFNAATTGDGGNIYQQGGLTQASSPEITDGYATATGGEGGNLYLTGGTFNAFDGYIKYGRAESGGGIAMSGVGPALNLLRVRMYDNDATTNGGSIYQIGGVAVINRSVITTSNAVNGAGIFQAGGSSTVINSTFSANYAGDNGGAIYMDAAAIGLINVTVYDNTAVNGGSGLYEFSTSSISVINTIIGGNTGAADCFSVGMTSLGNNLFVSGGGCNTTASDQVVANPAALLLGALSGDVHTPLDSSPALDNADGATCTSPASTNSIDQPGNVRTTTCDIGAVEATHLLATDTPVPPTSAPVVVPTETASPTPVTPTATRVVILRGTSTPRPTLTSAPTEEPTNTEEPTEAPTDEPTAVAQLAATATPEALVEVALGCRLVEPEVMSDAMLVTYGESGGEEDPLNWIICPEPPQSTCFGIDRPLPDDVQARLRASRAFDCTEDGVCTEYRFEDGTEDATVCLVPVESGISPDTAACTDGCAVALDGKLKPGQVAAIACVPAAIIAALIALLIFRRRMQQEEDGTTEQELAGGR